jgi:hypothetical protein
MAERLQVIVPVTIDGAINQLPRAANDATTGVHQVIGNTVNAVGMTASTRPLGRGQVSRKPDQSFVCDFFNLDRRIARVAGGTVACRKPVRLIESCLLGIVAVQAAIACRLIFIEVRAASRKD